MVKDYKGMVRWKKMPYGIDIDSLLIMEWLVTRGNMHDSPVSQDMVDSVRYFSYILADSAYDASDIYGYVFENTHAFPIIDTNTYIRLSYVIFYLCFNYQDA